MDLSVVYRKMVFGLFPRGLAWPRAVGTFLYLLVDGISQEWIRIHQRALQLIEEADPRTTTELLPDWERYLGLPDDCVTGSQTTEQRRNQVIAKDSKKGGQSPAYFEKIALDLGFAVTVTPYIRAFRCGHSRCGDALTNDWQFYWRVNAPLFSVTYFRAGGGRAGEPLAVWGNDLLECEIRRKKPAHTEVIFTYS